MACLTFGRNVGLLWVFLIFVVLPHEVTGAGCRTSKDCDGKQTCSISFCDQLSGVCVTFPKEGRNSSSCKTIATRTTKAALTARIESTPLLLSQKLAIISVASTLLGDVHPHRRLHTRFLGVDPLVALTALRSQVLKEGSNLRLRKLTNIQFHHEIIKVFNSVDDIHSRYLTPFPLRRAFAFIPITIREYFGDDVASSKRKLEPRFVLSDIGMGVRFGNTMFKKGVDIKTWDGVPMNKAVRLSGDAGFGSNNDSKLITGLRRLTRRLLSNELIPENPFVVIGFNAGNGTLQKVKIPWTFLLISDRNELPLSTPEPQNITRDMSLMKFLSSGFPKSNLNSSRAAANITVQTTSNVTVVPINPNVPQLEARIINSSSGPYGILKIRDFSPQDAREYLIEYVSALSQFPKNGVVIDVRRNTGGSVALSLFMVQFFTTKRLIPVEFSFRTTPSMSMLARELGVDRMSVDIANKIGDQYFARGRYFEEEINSYSGPRYNGPVIVLADAETYSSGDIFVSTVQDNEAGVVVGVHDNTGGAGTTVTFDRVLRIQGGLPLPFLPDGIRMSIAVTRLDRARRRSGVPLEFFGVTPDTRYFPTRRDQLEGDRDLLEFLGRKLREPRRESPRFQMIPRDSIRKNLRRFQ